MNVGTHDRSARGDLDIASIEIALAKALRDHAVELGSSVPPGLDTVRRRVTASAITRRGLLAAGVGVAGGAVLARAVDTMPGAGRVPTHVVAVPGVAGVTVAARGRVSVRSDAGANGVQTVTVRVVDGSGPITVRMSLARNERLVGLGERTGPLFLRGQRLAGWSGAPSRDNGEVSYSPMPVIHSSHGRTLLIDSTVRADWDLGATDPDAVTVAVHDSVVRFHLISAADLVTRIERTSAIVGRPPRIPAWGLGVWKTAIGGRQRVQADIDRLLASGAPLDAVWMYDLMDETSGFGWPWHVYAPIPTGHYGDPREIVDWLHGRRLKALGYVNPYIRADSVAWSEADGRGLLVTDDAGSSVVDSPSSRRSMPDFTDPRATAWFGARVAHAVGDVGLDGAMADYGENPPMQGRYHSGESGEHVHNRYAGLYLQAVRSAAEGVRPDETVFLARSGSLGSTAWTSARFTGDQERSWDPVRGIGGALRSMLSGSLSGWPYWGPDIGGYADPAVAVHDERELWLRWLQLGALSPLMRDHLGHMSGAPTDALSDGETVAAWRAYARLHRAVQPELVRLATVAQRSGLPIVRAMVVDHGDDETAWSCEDQYLIGHDLLVAPVLESGARERPVYLPSGRWNNFWTGKPIQGRAWTVAEAPVHQIPLFVRDGSRIDLPDPAQLWASG